MAATDGGFRHHPYGARPVSDVCPSRPAAAAPATIAASTRPATTPPAVVPTTAEARDRRLARIAASQDGLVTRRQLLHAGFASRTIERRVARGAFWIELRGVYAIGSPVRDLRRRLRARLLACGSGWFSHETAAGLLGFGPPLALAAPVHVTVLGRGRSRRSRDGLIVHQTATLPLGDRTMVDGLPVTAPARTLVDLGGRVDPRRLERMVNAAQVANGLQPTVLLGAIDRARGRRTTELRRIVSGSTGTRRSGLEDDLWRRLRGAGLADGAGCNMRIGPWEVDVAWPDARVVVEVDGFRYHRTRADRERDERKSRWFRARGYELLRFSDDEVARRPLAVVAEVAGALAVARHAL